MLQASAATWWHRNPLTHRRAAGKLNWKRDIGRSPGRFRHRGSLVDRLRAGYGQCPFWWEGTTIQQVREARHGPGVGLQEGVAVG